MAHDTLSLESLFVKKIAEMYQEINQSDWQARLETPIFRLSRSLTQWGSWNPSTREMSFSFPLLMDKSQHCWDWVIRHEMAHQVVNELFQQQEAKPHGFWFQQACITLGIQHSASFTSEPSPLGARIQKLLALAESDNPHEAELALKKAQVLAQDHFQWDPQKPTPFVLKLLTEVGRRSANDQMLASILQRHFGVFCVWISSPLMLQKKSAWVLEISGLAADLEIAEYVWHFVQAELKRLWRCHKRAHVLADKRSYLTGVMFGFRERLAEKQTADPPSGKGQLVLLRDQALAAFVEERHGSLRRGRGLKLSHNQDWAQGREQGRELHIHSPIRGEKPKALPKG